MGGSLARVARTWLVVLAVTLGVSVLLPASPAAAHNSLTGSDPKDGARVAAAPTRIELRFLATVSPATTKITVTGPGGADAAGGAPTFSGNRVSLPFAPGPAGAYTVTYRVGSTDGHPVHGEITFTLTSSAAATPAAGPVPAPTTATPTAPPTSPARPAAAASPAGRGAGWWWVVATVVALGLLGGGLLLRRRAARR